MASEATSGAVADHPGRSSLAALLWILAGSGGDPCESFSTFGHVARMAKPGKGRTPCETRYHRGAAGSGPRVFLSAGVRSAHAMRCSSRADGSSDTCVGWLATSAGPGVRRSAMPNEQRGSARSSSDFGIRFGRILRVRYSRRSYNKPLRIKLFFYNGSQELMRY